MYVKALCLTRFDEYKNAEDILNNLLDVDKENTAKYYYALGRIRKKEGNYTEAIELFETATVLRKRYLSPNREMAECYILLGDLKNAEKAIWAAKNIDDSNIFVILLEARLLQKQSREQEALDLLLSQKAPQNPDQVEFRLGRIYDQLGEYTLAKDCYKKVLAYNSKMYDAKLCILSHEILETPDTAKKELEALKPKLQGKRRAILTNIEARLVGYVEHQEKPALELLDSVVKRFRDRQWYSVRIQLLQNLVKICQKTNRLILSQTYQAQIDTLQCEFEQNFGEFSCSEFDFLPDT